MIDKPLPPERLAEIEARCNAATPGPWYSDAYESWGLYDFNPAVVRADGRQVLMGHNLICGAWVSRKHCEANGLFCSHARQDVPDLLAEVCRLGAENERLRGIVAELRDDMDE